MMYELMNNINERVERVLTISWSTARRSRAETRSSPCSETSPVLLRGSVPSSARRWRGDRRTVFVPEPSLVTKIDANDAISRPQSHPWSSSYYIYRLAGPGATRRSSLIARSPKVNSTFIRIYIFTIFIFFICYLL